MQWYKMTDLLVASLGKPLITIPASLLRRSARQSSIVSGHHTYKGLVIKMSPPVDREVRSLGESLIAPCYVAEVLLLLVPDLERTLVVRPCPITFGRRSRMNLPASLPSEMVKERGRLSS